MLTITIASFSHREIDTVRWTRHYQFDKCSMTITYTAVNFRDSYGERWSALSQRLVVKMHERKLTSYTDYCLAGQGKGSGWEGKRQKVV